MPRPQKRRRITSEPVVKVFKPAGVPRRMMSEVLLTVDELEAIRLAHLENYYQAAIARRMDVSRPTAGRILESAHRKIAEALVHGKALRIEGGVYISDPDNPKRCHRCGSRRGHGRRSDDDECPDCGHEEHKVRRGRKTENG